MADEKSTDERQAAATPPATGVGAGRGLVFITLAKLWFMVAGYVVQFALPRALGSPAKFGIWVLVLSVVSPLNNVMVTATIQGVSKFSSESTDPDRAHAVTRAALKMQSWLGGGTALAFFLLAPVISWFEHDPGLTGSLQLAAGIVLAYSFYAVFVGAANGARAFHKQAALDMAFSTLRALLVVGAALVTRSAFGAIGGFFAAAALILLISTWVVGLPARSRSEFSPRRLIRFFGGLATYLLIVNLLMFVDGLLLKRLVAEAAAANHSGDPVQLANAAEGFYGAVQAIARIPYQLILAVTFIIFPLVSRATFEKDAAKTRGYVVSTLRYSLIVVTLLAVVLGARPTAVMRLFYRPEYAVGSAALVALLIGYVCFSLFTIAGTIINGSGRTLPTTLIGLATLTIAIVATNVAITFALAQQRDPLLYAAGATTLAMASGVAIMGVYLRSQFGAFLPWRSVLRVGVSIAITVGVAQLWPSSGFLTSKFGTLISCAQLTVVFVAVLLLTGELKIAELRHIRKI